MYRYKELCIVWSSGGYSPSPSGQTSVYIYIYICIITLYIYIIYIYTYTADGGTQAPAGNKHASMIILKRREYWVGP